MPYPSAAAPRARRPGPAGADFPAHPRRAHRRRSSGRLLGSRVARPSAQISLLQQRQRERGQHGDGKRGQPKRLALGAIGHRDQNDESAEAGQHGDFLRAVDVEPNFSAAVGTIDLHARNDRLGQFSLCEIRSANRAAVVHGKRHRTAYNDPMSVPFSWQNPYAWPRKPLFARNVVSTSQPLASQAGLQMLAAGGSAVDAILATAITLTLVEPVSNGIGSDAYAIVWDGNRLHGMNASGRSPAGWTPEYVSAWK